MEKTIISILFFLLPLFALPYQDFYNFELGKGFLLLLFALAGLTVWLVRSLAAGSISWRSHRFHPFLGVFLLWTALSLFFAANPYFTLQEGALLLGALAVYWLLAVSCTRSEDFSFLFFLVAVSAGLVSLLALLQAAGFLWKAIPDQYGEPMITGTFDHANHAAQFLVVSLPLTAGLLGSASVSRRRIAFLSLLLQFAFLILTRSRAAWVVALFTLLPAFFFLLRPFRRRHLLLLLALVLITIGLFLKIPETASQRTLFTHLKTLFSTQYSSNRIRLWVWSDTLTLIRSHPLRGVGAGNFPVEFPRVQSDRLARELAHLDQIVESPHNEYLRILAESGLPGIVLLFAALLFLLLPLIRLLRSRESPEEDFRLLFSLLFALGALLLDSGFDHPLTKTAPLLLLALLAAGLARLSPGPERVRSISIPSRSGRRGLTLLSLLASGAILISLSGWIASDYFRAGARQAARHAYTEAVVMIDKSLKINPTSYLSHFLRGNYLSSLGKAGQDPLLFSKSLPSYQRALELYPTFYPALLNQGQVLLWLGLPLESRKALEGALALQPYQPEANLLLAAILQRQGETGEARRRLELALALQPRLEEEIRKDPLLKSLFSDPDVIESETGQK